MPEITPTQKVAIDVQNALDTIKFLAEACRKASPCMAAGLWRPYSKDAKRS